ncbi:RidA family protein [Flavihumibacter rivuli]|uniref:RidA family protein n=1 Tax=Flavihumibacter rivuli TaxID=2838156 RepID=UPI001BDEA01E|nr:RidA family protein [Flavihumibacter rivuli]ULQ57102.1 RidA family protein [Flavihumibacter rivuli]
MKSIYPFFLLFISLAGFLQADSSLVKFYNPSSVSKPTGYSHTAEIDLGNCKMVMISGQIALDNKGNLIGKGNLAEQTEQVFKNLKNIVQESGGTMDDIVRIGIYMIDVSQVQTMREIRSRFFNQQNPPTSTLVQVSKLVRDDLLIEIEATAIIPKKKKRK